MCSQQIEVAETPLATTVSYTNGRGPSSERRLRGRPYVHGKFIFAGHEKLYIRGVTYGPFRPEPDGSEYHAPQVVARDFASMRDHGINAIRTYTVPPRWLLDLAHEHGLYVMVGIPWEQHITFLDDDRHVRSIIQRTASDVHSCAGHPGILAYTIGNEIPSPIVRWHGKRHVEQFLRRLYETVKAGDPGGLVTYVNYPTTEYLELPFVDFVTFNVYLESQDRLEAYLARLQNLAGDRPLVMAEIGLDSRRNGEETQAETLRWQIETIFQAGCAGAFVFSWTDEWHRGGYDIEDWDFGLTRRNRTSKPALSSVSRAYEEIPFPHDVEWPYVSVVVCSYNGSRTIRETCEGLSRLKYPNYEVIIVDDGSTDDTSDIVAGYGFRVIRTPNLGLSNARNRGWQAACGEIVAYLDDDAAPDSHWLTYLAAAFLNTEYAGIGGPNIPPPGDGLVAECVSNSPGGPNHVLLTDTEAEHIPGCNMAFRRTCLQAVHGFDPQFRIAGDDVDICWRLQAKGWKLGFAPSAVVWHHYRNTVRGYWTQQINYGKAEALLEMKWPQKYSSLGHPTWKGSIYGPAADRSSLFRRTQVYQGVWGTRLFQTIYDSKPGTLAAVPLMPEWYLIIAGLAALAVFGFGWPLLALAAPLFAIAVLITLAQTVSAVRGSRLAATPGAGLHQAQKYALTLGLHLLQPLARLLGRMRYGLTPWRRHGVPAFRLPYPRSAEMWYEEWRSSTDRLEQIESDLQAANAVVRRGGDFDEWDLEVRGGILGCVRALMAIEEHGGGKQLVRMRSWPAVSVLVWTPLLVLAAVTLTAALAGAYTVALILGLVAILLALRALGDSGAAMASYLTAIDPAAGYRAKADRLESAGSEGQTVEPCQEQMLHD